MGFTNEREGRMAKQCIRLYIGDDGEPRETDEPCETDHGVELPAHKRQLAPPKFALHKAAAYFTGATVYPAIGMWRPRDVDEPEVEASFVLEIITADTDAWAKALALAEDVKLGLQQEAVLAVRHSIDDAQLVE